MNEQDPDDGGTDHAERERAEPGFVDMASIARRRLQGMGGDLGRVAAVFDRAVGPQIARAASPVSLKRGTLRVQCTSASWAQSLTFMQAEVLAQLQAACPEVELTALRAVVGQPIARPDAPAAPAQVAPTAPLDATTGAALERAARAIVDPELRERVLRAAQVSVARRRQLDENP